MYRQGDLLIVADELPTYRERRPVVSRIVQFGEATGHAHILEGGEVFDFDNTTYLTSAGEARLVHDEHETIVLPEGTYRVIRQREWAESGWANVSD